MPLTPRLSRKLRQTLGEEATGDLVNWMQQVDTQRAEQRDLVELNFARFDARLAEVRQETRADLAELRQETKAGLAELRQDLSRLETKLERGACRAAALRYLGPKRRRCPVCAPRPIRNRD